MVVIAGLIFLVVASSSGIAAVRLAELTPTAFAHLPFVQVRPSPTPPIETWLDQVNGYREQAGVPAAYEDFTLSYKCHKHTRYMAENNLLTHDQIPGLPFASFEGQLCAQNSLVWLSDFSSPHWLPVDSIDEWMGSVGHRLWMYYPTTTTFGYGFYTTANNRTGAALDVLSAANFGADGGYLGWPVRYPAPRQVGVPATAYPITLNWRYQGDIPIITSTSLTTASGTPIYHLASDGWIQDTRASKSCRTRRCQTTWSSSSA